MLVFLRMLPLPLLWLMPLLIDFWNLVDGLICCLHLMYLFCFRVVFSLAVRGDIHELRRECVRLPR